MIWMQFEDEEEDVLASRLSARLNVRQVEQVDHSSGGHRTTLK